MAIGKITPSIKRLLLTTAFALHCGVSISQTVTAVLHAPLRGLDPVMGTPYMFRNYGYMVYDTLLALDANDKVQPQMASWKTSSDGKTYTFTLRDGLKWHDGKPVTADDCVASVQRWMKYDKLGALMAAEMSELKVTGDKSFEMTFKSPTDVALRALSKPSGVPPLMMPKWVIDAAGAQPITASIGSGPFKFVASEYKPGVQAVFEKNPDYVPRSEPASGLAGGKVVKVDRVRWVVMPDAMTAVNALQNGEIDMVEMLPHDMLPLVEQNPALNVITFKKQAFQNLVRLNFTQPPFNNKKIRQAALLALGQKAVLEAQSGNPKLFRTCAAVCGCDGPFASNYGADRLIEPQPKLAKALLAEAKYDNTPVVVLQVPESAVSAPIITVVAEQLKAGGFNVQVVNLDTGAWIARRASKAAPTAGGWSLLATANVLPEVNNPIGFAPAAANGNNAYFGWPDLPQVEDLRLKMVRSADPGLNKKLAEELQQQIIDEVIYIPMGEFNSVIAKRKALNNFLDASVPVFWNLTKTGK